MRNIIFILAVTNINSLLLALFLAATAALVLFAEAGRVNVRPIINLLKFHDSALFAVLCVRFLLEIFDDAIGAVE